MNYSYECCTGTRKEILRDVRSVMTYEYVVKTKAIWSEYNIPIACFIYSHTLLIYWTAYWTSIRNEISTTVFKAQTYSYNKTN